jgi:hypothetical protein
MKRKPRRALGPAPPGFSCALCGQGGTDIVQIVMHRGCVSFMHRACAEKFFGVPVMEKVETKKSQARLGSGVCG